MQRYQVCNYFSNEIMALGIDLNIKGNVEIHTQCELLHRLF